MLTVLCFGNPALKEDALALTLGKKMKMEGVRFVLCSSADALLEHAEEEFIILDVAHGVKKPTLLDGSEQLGTHILVSLHDFDVGFFLKVLEKMNGKKIKILAIPFNAKKKDVETSLKKILDNDAKKKK